MAERKKGAGGKLNRSEIVTVRFDPRVHFGAELAAVRQRRTLSSFIEGAVESHFETIKAGPNLTVAQVLDEVWSPDPVVRFVRLGFKYPHLLSHDQQRLWELICEYPALWKGEWDGEYWVWQVQPRSLILPRLRKLWDKLNEVAEGEIDISELPQLRKPRFVKVLPMTDEQRRALAEQERWRTSDALGGEELELIPEDEKSDE